MKNLFLISLLFVLSITVGCFDPEPPERKFVSTLAESIKHTNEWEDAAKTGSKSIMYMNRKRNLIVSLAVATKSTEQSAIYIRSINNNTSITLSESSDEFDILYNTLVNKKRIDTVNELSKLFPADSVTTSKSKS